MGFDGGDNRVRIAREIEIRSCQGDDFVTGKHAALDERASDLTFATGDNDPHA
jgi:hypothetical protein